MAPSAYLPTNAARRGLFKRLLHPGRTASLVPCRPPGARAEADFIDLCSRCEACLRACPSQIIVRGDGGLWFSGAKFLRRRVHRMWRLYQCLPATGLAARSTDLADGAGQREW